MEKEMKHPYAVGTKIVTGFCNGHFEIDEIRGVQDGLYESEYYYEFDNENYYDGEGNIYKTDRHGVFSDDCGLTIEDYMESCLRSGKEHIIHIIFQDALLQIRRGKAMIDEGENLKEQVIPFVARVKDQVRVKKIIDDMEME